ncbi:2,3-diaminopropionate biosynthesis protein SbnB [Lentzea sp. NPDC051208]|uniref:2,3-diaminopropionate biosynthesis protein SbnB n=1 Tax=Lentzea sp. NPDC051208 TaxID=3154642 RepID=UPI00344AA6DA
MLILGAAQVRQVLDGAEQDVLSAVRSAYVLHAAGRTVVPHSSFLRFPDDDRNRIIALPAYLGTESPVAGIKWISSFPGNVANGLERASAALILNSMETGHPTALLESSTISARRTAASAALAAAALPAGDTGVALVGCGVINFEVLRFLRETVPSLETVTLFDLSRERSEAFGRRVEEELGGLKVEVAGSLNAALSSHRLISFATVAGVPHTAAEACAPGTLILHVSLRDLTASAILRAVNVVDDADHVCRASTSLHLAEQEVGHRNFIDASIGELLGGSVSLQRAADRLTIFSPFGLGALDLAVAALVADRAQAMGIGTSLPDFLG